ncbi:phosphoribosylglycinamide formyltransferase [Robertmurraya korlensis]|uniref:phosphoribosylglycinamide formyltransferase n=1 Tax=Robertmurraya korlensis TaxID=519977 RepID=UPI00203FA42D|nr:phosphoribosylglycinamide formyltransferase [Robertmurraya korlensis]MCM3602829.1 phosphoribosylglycinamide formyltransferase [Robertmurraya korlensis]
MKNIAVFASGSGSNFGAILEAIQVGELEAKVQLLVCDQPSAYAIQRAEEAGVPTFVFRAKDYPSKTEYEQEICALLTEKNIDLVVLAGYMRLIGPTLLTDFEGKIINIHPSMLPAFPGKDAIGQALAANVKESGVTVHYVDAGMDTGPIIAQQAVVVDEGETKESLQKKIHEVEHKLYPAVISELLKGERRTESEKTSIN